ncbi:hypothetical protein [Flavobacterium sp.]|uniref:hypothetical protein n=1 Tax=Flavobacterium sp. TaxID=239 RepID=UPI00248A519B|nr:hypothetical protein [Flavobacterium sp.]MDI1317396.1 hypothetical protein [Flavobacterium sp.]
MEENSKTNHDPKHTDFQQNNKAYPGHTSEQQKGNHSDEVTPYTELSDEEKDARLADFGPVRNPNYHDVNDDNNITSSSANRYRKDTHHHKTGTDGKTLEDFNKIEPKRDINKAANNENKTPGR